MYCTYCGNQVQTSERFCAQCGKASTPPDAPGAPRQGPRRLMLDVANKKIAGVCAGFASYLGWDVTLVRILFLAGIFLHGASLIVYLVCWIAMPRSDSPAYA